MPVKEGVINNSVGSPVQGSDLTPSSRSPGSPQKAGWAASSAGKFIKNHISNIQLHIRLLSKQGNLYLSLGSNLITWLYLSLASEGNQNWFLCLI